MRWQDLSLYARVIAAHTSILLVAALVLVLTPVTVSFPLAAEQGVVLGLGLLLTVLANAVILRRNFRGLAELVQRMENVYVVQPRERLQVVGGERLVPRSGASTPCLSDSRSSAALVVAPVSSSGVQAAIRSRSWSRSSRLNRQSKGWAPWL